MSADPFIAQLAELCRQHPTRAKWVFVPTHAVGLTIGDRLAREGTDWVNLRFVTPLDVAVPMAAPFLLERGIDPSGEAVGPSLIMRLLLDLPEEGGYFRPMAEHASMADALWRTIRELRQAGLRTGDLPQSAFRSAAKINELGSLVRAYESYLAESGITDMSGVYEEAPSHPECCPIGHDDVWVELPDVAWAPIVRRFLDALPGTREPVQTFAIDFPVPRRVLALGSPRTGVGDEPAVPNATVRIFRAGGHEAEVEEVVRRILASGRRLDEVEVVCGSETLALVAWERAKRFEWPVTSSAGLPAAMTRPGRALRAWCDWIEGGFSVGDLRRLLESGDVAFTQATDSGRGHPAQGAAAHAGGGGSSAPDHAAGDAAGCSTQQAARILRRAGATWGRATYRAALASYAHHQERMAAERGPDEAWRLLRAAQSRWLIGEMSALLDPIPEPGVDGLVAVADLLDAAAGFVGGYARRTEPLDVSGHLAVMEAILNLRALGPVRMALPWALRFLTDAVQSVRVGRSRSKPGHLHVSMFADAGYEGRPVTFVCGLEEARVFPAAVEDPVLLDAEREAINASTGSQAWLRSSGDRVAEAVHAGLLRLARLGACSDEVILSFSCVDTREFREAFPSWLVLRAYRAASGNPKAGYLDLRRAAGEPVSVVPATRSEAPATTAWWLEAGRMGDRAVTPLVAAYPGIGRGRLALAGRDSDVFTEFDGWVPDAGPALDPSRNGMVVSATLLESAAACPFRFFLERGLGLEPVDEEESGADVWLDPLRRGSELHSLYAALLRRARGERRRVSVRDDLQWFLDLGRARLAELRQELPPPSEEVAERESAEWLDDLRLFVEAEADQRGIEPIAFEVGFGRAAEDDTEALAAPDPIAIELGAGRRLMVAGRIDRIDRLRFEVGARSSGMEAGTKQVEAGPSDPGRYRVLDYKTGRFSASDYVGTFRRGTLLQHALYGVAAARMLKSFDRRAAVVEGVYWHPTGRGWGRYARIPAPLPDSLANALAKACDVIGHGLFLQAPARKEGGRRYTKDACRYCDFQRACGRGPAEIAARKVAANAHGRLAPWLALQEVE